MRSKFAGRLFIFSWFFIGGISHFVFTVPFLKIMPPYIPYPLVMVYISGFFELVGACAIMSARWRSAAGYGLMLLTMIVTLANVQMLQHPELFPDIPYWLLVVRLPLQALLIWIIWRASRPDQTRRS